MPPIKNGNSLCSLRDLHLKLGSVMSKANLRRSLLQQRRQLAPEVWQQHSQRLCHHLQADPLFNQAKTVLAYFSIRQEPDLSPLFELPKIWGFPRCIGQELSWHVWSPAGELTLQSGAFGILEPHSDAPSLEPEQIDLMLVPAVACARQGYRLGYGGGFYDRLLAEPKWAKVPTIGVIFGFAHLQTLPIDEWDQPLTGVCTEAGIFLATR
jgi:5-formyltetrahydrofolate cyclo-ligase